MPVLTYRTFPSREEQPECHYKFELNKEEKEKFFNEFLSEFFDQSQLGDLELRDTTVEFSLKLFKKKPVEEPEEDILID